MATIIDVRNIVSEPTNVRYQWGKGDFAQIVEDRSKLIKIRDSAGNNLFVKFDEVEHLTEALKRISLDIKSGNFVQNFG